jgi:hypothetical protein
MKNGYKVVGRNLQSANTFYCELIIQYEKGVADKVTLIKQLK